MSTMPSIHNKPAKGFLMERRMHGNTHVRCGERGRRNHDEESSNRRFRLYSTNPEPSPEDDETTQDLDRGSRLIGLFLIDHVIIGETGHYSYADSGRLQEFRES